MKMRSILALSATALSIFLTACGWTPEGRVTLHDHRSRLVRALTQARSRITRNVTTTAQGPSEDLTYNNTLWGFSLSIPTHFKAAIPFHNGSGESWHYGSALVSVSGQYPNALGAPATLSGVIRKIRKEQPTYVFSGNHWLIAAGNRGQHHYYTKIYLLHGQEDILNITYPDRVSGTWNTQAKYIAESFHPEPLPKNP